MLASDPMRYQKLDMNLLVALDALLTDPHVTRAAERLNVTQSAMSGSLGRLREYFDDELVRQAGRRMVLTALGKELRDPVRELLALTDRVLATKASFDPRTSERSFTLHCTDFVWVTMISGLVVRLGKDAPGIRLEYAPAVSDFIERRADFAIKADRFRIGDYPTAPLFSDPMVCIAWTGNDEIGETLSEDEFFELPHIAAYSPHPSLTEDWVARHYDRRYVVSARVPNFSLVPQTIVGTRCIGIVPHRNAQRYASFLPLRILRSPVEFPALSLVLQWHPQHEGDAGLRWFRDVLIASAGYLNEVRRSMPA
jgi:LysR family nod box-dependent transcriptional activator